MKKIFIILGVVLLTGCAKKSHNNLEGTWVSFSTQWGLIELVFQNDNTVINRNYGQGGDPDWEFSKNYSIIDDVLFLNGTANNYALINNKLFLAKDGGTWIYTKKENDMPVSARKKLLIGQWKNEERVLTEEGRLGSLIGMEFFDDSVILREYDAEERLIAEYAYPYEITDKYIFIKNIEQKTNFGQYMNEYVLNSGIYLYKINAKSLIFKYILQREASMFAELFLIKQQ